MTTTAKKPKLVFTKPDFLVQAARAQPLTARYKAPVWVGTEQGTLAKIVVKGPMKEQELKNQMLTERIRKICYMPSTGMRIYQDKFIVSRSLYEFDLTQTYLRSTEFEDDIPLLLVRPEMWKDDYLDDPKAQSLVIDMFLTLAFRRAVGSNDTCDRNLVVADDHVYSVDDAYVRELDLAKHLWKKPKNPKIAAKFYAALDRHWTHVESGIEDWIGMLSIEDPTSDIYWLVKKMIERSTYFLTKSNWKF